MITVIPYPEYGHQLLPLSEPSLHQHNPSQQPVTSVAYPGLVKGGCSARICNVLRMRRWWVGVASSVSTYRRTVRSANLRSA